MTFEEFVKTVDHQFNTSSYKSQLRYGQTIMNVLHDVWHKKYLEISDSDLDCFYDNATVRFTLEKLEKEWDEIN